MMLNTSAYVFFLSALRVVMRHDHAYLKVKVDTCIEFGSIDSRLQQVINITPRDQFQFDLI